MLYLLALILLYVIPALVVWTAVSDPRNKLDEFEKQTGMYMAVLPLVNLIAVAVAVYTHLTNKKSN